MPLQRIVPMPATEIIKGLVWLGSMDDANDESFLRTNNIRVILNCAGEQEKTSVPVDVYKQLNALDAANYPILERHSDEATHILSIAVSRRDPILVHCAAGINRSATLLADFLVQLTMMPAQDVMLWLKSLRPIVFSNHTFVQQMIRKYSPT
jgi:protein-tyrosine phosphatase